MLQEVRDEGAVDERQSNEHGIINQRVPGSQLAANLLQEAVRCSAAVGPTSETWFLLKSTARVLDNSGLLVRSFCTLQVLVEGSESVASWSGECASPNWRVEPSFLASVAIPCFRRTPTGRRTTWLCRARAHPKLQTPCSVPKRVEKVDAGH